MPIDRTDLGALTRRTFLAAAAGSAVATASRPATASEAPRRPPHMKLSLAGYSFNRYLPRNWTPQQLAEARMTLEKFIEFCAELNLDATELTGYYFPREISNEYLNHLKNLTFRLGLDISGTAIGNDFCTTGEKREQQLQMTRDWIDYSATMGAPVIRIFAGKVPAGDSEEAAIERCIDGINESLKYAATKGVFLALENHGGITSTPAQMLKIIEGVETSPWFGVNFDSGNFRTADPYGDLEQIAPYAINAQVKVAIAPHGKKEEADLKRIVGILKQAGYRGYVVLEYEESHDPWQTIPRYIDQLREMI